MGGKKRKRKTGREKRRTEQRGERKSSFRETILMPGIVSFLFPVALTFRYCSGLRKTDLS